jgi:hypothetical protein
MKIKKYTPPTSGFKLALAFEDITTIRMALENKLRHDRNKMRGASPNSKKFWRKETRHAIKALRGVWEGDMYVD